jgi:carbamoyl-phosphate synthase large subunit
MRIVINDEELEEHVFTVLREMPDNQLLIDRFLDGAVEAEADAMADGQDVHILAVMEHIEPAGIHSGDSTAVLPPFNLGAFTVATIEDYTRRIARALNVQGLINVQFAIHHGTVYVIEANPRASRTVPFIGKAHHVPYVNMATKLMLGTHKLKDFTISPQQTGFAIKLPVFSFHKFPGVEKILGPEMKSTGEEIRFVDSVTDPVFEKLYDERNMYLSR